MVEWLGGKGARQGGGASSSAEGRCGKGVPALAARPKRPCHTQCGSVASVANVASPNSQSLDSLYLLPARPPRAGGCSRSGAARFRHAGRIRITDLNIVRLVCAELDPALAVPPPACGAFLFRNSIDSRHLGLPILHKTYRSFLSTTRLEITRISPHSFYGPHYTIRHAKGATGNSVLGCCWRIWTIHRPPLHPLCAAESSNSDACKTGFTTVPPSSALPKRNQSPGFVL